MAMQTGVASSKVLILVGAGLTGSIILRNGRLSEVLFELQELIKGVNEAELPSGRYDASILAAQIRHLAQEVRELTLSRPVAIINGESSSSGSFGSYILPAAVLGVMGYCYMWWKGFSFSDVMFVTKRNMANAVSTVSKQLEQVSAALASTKRHLTQRLEALDGKLDEQRETSKVIITEVNEVKLDLSEIGFDLEAIQHMITGLEGKIELIESKQDVTNAGLLYLCQITGGIKEGFNAKFFQEAVAKLSGSHLSLTSSDDHTLKGLQFLAEAIKPGAEEPSSNDTSPMELHDKPKTISSGKMKAVHRSYTSNLSLAKRGFVL